MKRYLVRLLTFFVVSSFVYDVRAMDSRDSCIVDIASYQHNDYRQSISDVGRSDLAVMRLSLEKEIFCPKSVSPIDHLLYLSTIQKNSTQKTLFTQKHQNKFDDAARIKRWVPRCFAINAATIILTASIPFTASVGLLQCSNATAVDCLSQAQVMFVPAAVACAGALLVGFSSLYATGISPDLSSQKADMVQDRIGSLHDDYLAVAKYWIDLHFEHAEKAQYIANFFDIDELKDRIALKTRYIQSSRRLLDPLEEAWSFIKNGKILATLTMIELYINGKINSRRISCIEQLLEKHEQEALKKE